ncbi:unnamed protein product [Boreogadus saida]
MPRSKTCCAAGPNSFPSTMGRVRRVLWHGSDNGDWASHTWRRTSVSVNISLPSSLVMKHFVNSSSVMQHCGLGQRAFCLNPFSGGTMREAMVGSTAGIRSGPCLLAFCIEAKALLSLV